MSAPTAPSPASSAPATVVVVEQPAATAASPVASAPPSTVSEKVAPAAALPAHLDQPANNNPVRVQTMSALPMATQQSLPAATSSPPRIASWRQGFFHPGSFGACLGSWFCSPCFLGDVITRAEDYPLVESTDYCTPCCCYASQGFPIPSFPVAWWARTEFRKKFGIQGSGIVDCCASFWCPCFVASQMHQELKRMSNSEPSPARYAAPQGSMMYQPPQGRIS